MNIQPPSHIISALDPNLVTTFENQTNWIVFTGTSCCGKTTMINQLATQGYLTVPEVARRYFDCEMAKGRKIEDLRSNLEAVERIIMNKQVQCESELNCDDIVFLDRALPDNLTFFRYADVDPNQYLGTCFRNRYAGVYVLDPFPIERDGIRIEGEELRVFLDTWLPRDYRSLGYEVQRIPVMSRTERLDFVLRDLTEKGLV